MSCICVDGALGVLVGVEMPSRDTIPRCRLAGLKCNAILNSLFVDKDCGIVDSA